ncbi:MAG: acyltransferase family protein [Oscillospiraceae bacterium]|nr:acyltransferase family protein [Oscillospiraceae bacterium]
MEIKQRRSNLELLRIVAMLMIIAFHIYWHCVSGQLTDPDSMERMGNGLFSVPLFYKKLLLLTVFSSFGRAANVVFMTLTGYFMVAKGREIRLIPIAKKLLLEQGYAAVLLLITSLLVFRRNPDSCTTLTEINLFNSMSWYVGYYFLVMLLARLFLNRYLEKLERKQYRLFLFALLCMTQFKWIIKLLNGVTGNLVILVTGVFLYSLGGYIRRYQPFARVRTWAIFGVIAGIYALLFLSTYAGVQDRIQDYYREASTDPFIQYIPNVGDNSIVAILLGLSLFELFRRIKMPCCRGINYLGGATFMIYLFHDNSFFYSLWDKQDWITLLCMHPMGFLLRYGIWTVRTFVYGLIAYLGFRLLCRLCRKAGFQRLFLKSNA